MWKVRLGVKGKGCMCACTHVHVVSRCLYMYMCVCSYVSTCTLCFFFFLLLLSICPNQISTWITDVGNKFLVTNTSVGTDGAANQRLLKKHDTFEHETVVRWPGEEEVIG